MENVKVTVKIEELFGREGVSVYINGDELVKHTDNAITLVSGLSAMEALGTYDIHFE
jgi:hypothetical protein